ncbi:hypothetical protein E3E12_01480 [Formicincola oecophyllae]|uniref:Uncharacterized protein n=1 Tax=Formicincola oecophyllae TaxID=2558361 RepID=A0A4Y6U945_9PROT|nr:hypothetical protein [Formicincola oecophyllae]QDH13088.1 hypothetical protein E3E12_01480 [Formicincola oecophyllae]
MSRITQALTGAFTRQAVPTMLTVWLGMFACTAGLGLAQLSLDAAALTEGGSNQTPAQSDNPLTVLLPPEGAPAHDSAQLAHAVEGTVKDFPPRQAQPQLTAVSAEKMQALVAAWHLDWQGPLPVAMQLRWPNTLRGAALHNLQVQFCSQLAHHLPEALCQVPEAPQPPHGEGVPTKLQRGLSRTSWLGTALALLGLGCAYGAVLVPLLPYPKRGAALLSERARLHLLNGGRSTAMAWRSALTKGSGVALSGLAGAATASLLLYGGTTMTAGQPVATQLAGQLSGPGSVTTETALALAGLAMMAALGAYQAIKRPFSLPNWQGELSPPGRKPKL